VAWAILFNNTSIYCSDISAGIFLRNFKKVFYTFTDEIQMPASIRSNHELVDCAGD
jgi:hypothetical protein